MKLFDVVAINLKTSKVRIFARDKDEANADAIIRMSVARRGVDEECYGTTAPGKYNDGDTYDGDGLEAQS